MSRDRMGGRERGYGRQHGYGDFEGRPGAFFGGRGDRDYRGERDWRSERDSDSDRGRRGSMGGWGGLMGEDRERDRYRSRGEDRDRYRSRGEDRRFGSDDYNRGVPMDETERLIASNKVEGTPVYDRHGEKLGSIHNFMVDKRRGQVVYAVLRHGGGFLGLNERYYPLDWDQLTYDTRLGGYHTELDEEDLESFGSFDSEGRWHRRSRADRSTRGRDREFGREREMHEPW